MKRILAASMICLAIACNSAEEKQVTTDTTTSIVAGKSTNSDAFNAAFEGVLGSYYTLKDNFIAENDAAIDSSAKKLLVLADSLSLDGVGVDSATIGTAKTYVTGISAELKGLLGEKDREEKRKAFQMVGEQLYELTRIVRYDRAAVYHQYCPMAFNDQGATWLSNSSDIRNPYLPKKMLECGEVKDTIDLRVTK